MTQPAPVVFQWSYFFFNDTATTEIYTLSLHDALPIPSRRSLAFVTQMSGATVPDHLQQAIDEAPDDDAIRKLGVQHCIRQCTELLEAGVPGLHFYTFNRARAAIEILGALRGQQLLAS